MANTFISKGALRVVGSAQVDQYTAQQDGPTDKNPTQDYTRLAGHIRHQFEMMKRHRQSSRGWNERMLHAQRTFNGEYHPALLAEIKAFGGSEIYARVVAVKCRGASALLRDVYLGAERAWGLEPTPDPTLPDEVTGNIKNLVMAEANTQVQSGQPVDAMQIKDRVLGLMDAAKMAAKKRAAAEAKKAEDKLDDILVEGNFYKAVAETLIDIPLFPFCCVKGPIVRIVPLVTWVEGRPVMENRPRMFWQRVSPFDVYWTPGVQDIEDATVIERVQYTRADLNALIGLPGYDDEAIRTVLTDHGKGINDWLDSTDTERADNESRENPMLNESGMIQGAEFHGSVQGDMLLDYGFKKEDIPDPVLDYFIQAWMIGRHVIKVQISPSPRKRHPYFITSFEKVPGTPVGNALPDVLAHIQDACNASLRALLNNMAISSGPQVVVNSDVMVEGTDTQSLYPWKRWNISVDPMMQASGSTKPIDFFQPNSNAQELLGVYEKFTQMADELSAIPRYTTGSDRIGGAGRTASGLAMLMGNASKVLQNVAGNYDRDVVAPVLQSLYDMVMLTDTTGTFRGDESVNVKGVAVAVQRETNRQRQMEFLQVTSNPTDFAIMGVKGRASVLRSVSNELGLKGEEIIPSEEELIAQEKAKLVEAQQAAMMQGMMGGAPGADGQQETEGGPPKEQTPSGQQGVSQQPAPKNTSLGVPEAGAMRGMA